MTGRVVGPKVVGVVMPLLLILAGCFGSNVPVEQPLEVDSCDQLVDVGIALVNDYVYTLQDTDLGATQGDPEKLPASLVTLNLRGSELDARIVELDCDAVAINQAVADATAGIQSDDPVVIAFLDAVRGGIVSPVLPTYGTWLLDSGTVSGQALAPVPDHPITLQIERDAASGFAGCNGYYYPATFADGLWTWTGGTPSVTDLSCQDAGGETPAAVIKTEADYLQGLRAVTGYSLEGEALVLSGDGVELRFVRGAGQPTGG
ncbi:MAG: META domain-containing protein [Acidimicrobiia bacterium]